MSGIPLIATEMVDILRGDLAEAFVLALALKRRLAPLSQWHHQPRCRGIVRCSRSWCDRGAAGQRADFRCAGKSASPWFDAASASYRQVTDVVTSSRKCRNAPKAAVEAHSSDTFNRRGFVAYSECYSSTLRKKPGHFTYTVDKQLGRRTERSAFDCH